MPDEPAFAYEEIPYVDFLGTPNPPLPAWYHVRTPADPQARPVFRCACGQFLSLARHHIRRDGTCWPAIIHAAGEDPPGCGYRALVKLVDYRGREFAEPRERRRQFWRLTPEP